MTRNILKRRIFFWDTPKRQEIGIIKSETEKTIQKTHQKRVKKVVTTNNTPIAVEPQKTHKTSVIKHIVKKPVKRKTIKQVKQELDKQVNKTEENEENEEKPPFIGFKGKKEENK